MVRQAFQALVYAARQRLWACMDAALRYDRDCRVAHVYAWSTWRADNCLDHRAGVKFLLGRRFSSDCTARCRSGLPDFSMPGM